MIKRLNYKNSIDIYDFVLRVEDKFQDFYLTQDKQRIFIKEIKLIEKLLKYQEVYAVEDNEIQAIMIVLHEKGFRSYVKLLSSKIDYSYDLLKSLSWNYEKKELFIKIKKTNPICKILQRYGWTFAGDRGQEVLYIKKAKMENIHGYHSNKT
jgi:hypothetical protein